MNVSMFEAAFLGGAMMAGDLSPQKARLLLMLMLHQGQASKTELQAAVDRQAQAAVRSNYVEAACRC
jgi:L-asparaginase/Glu-tRNA(Gln) amidotransferase subunit D